MLRSCNHRRIGACVVWALFRSLLYTYRPFSVLVCKLPARLRSAPSASTMKNSACWPSDVCPMTHGAIVCAAVGGRETVAPCWLATREAAIAPAAAVTAATRNNEQKTRRHDEGVNV